MENAALKKDFLDRLFSRFVDSLRIDRAQNSKVIWLSIVIVALFATMMIATPRMLISDYFYDFFIPLDGALRSLAGQRPHVDFYTPVGDLYYALLGFCARVFGTGPKVVLWQQIIVLPAVIGVTLIATRDRLPDSLRGMLVVMVGLLCVSPSDLDEPGSFSFLASYNRHGWILMIPVLAACLLEAQIVRRRAWITDAILLAAIVTALFYLKITFAVVAMGTLLLAAICIPQNRLSCVLAIFLTVIAIGLIALSGPSLVGYLNDLHRASLAAPFAGQNYDPFRLLKLKENLTQEWFNLLAPVCFAVWLGRTSTTLAERDSANRILLLCMIASAGSIALGWQNHEHSMPSQIVAMAISFAAIRRRQIARDHANRSTQSLPSNWPPVVFAGCIFAFMACVSILDNGRSVIIHTIKTALDIGQPVATLSPNLQGLIVPNDNKPGVISDILAGKIDPALYSEKSKTNWHNDVAKILDNGWELFQAHQPHNPRIATIFSAPVMTSLTGTVPPRHMAAWMDVERTVGPRSPVIPERDLADTNVVMVFKLYDHELIFDMIKDYLGANFHIAGETPIWQMWVRNGDQ